MSQVHCPGKEKGIVLSSIGSLATLRRGALDGQRIPGSVDNSAENQTFSIVPCIFQICSKLSIVNHICIYIYIANYL